MTQINGNDKKMGFWTATSLVVGSVIGSGVFMKPASMAAQLESPIWLTLVWIIAGIFTLLGALVFAELGAMFPQTGGTYAYFRIIFGKFPAFLFGWAAFVVINTAAVAAISFVCAQYSDYFLQLPRFSIATERSVPLHIPFIGDLYILENAGVKLLAIVLVVIITYLNYRSLKAGNYFQFFSTTIKLLVIGMLIIGILFSGEGNTRNFFEATNPKTGSDLLTAIVVAMTGAFFAYDGWVNVNFMGGEIRNPQRNIPRSLFAGVFICIGVYVLVNQAYLYVLPVEQMAASKIVAADAMGIAWGSIAQASVAAMIVICTLGALNGNIMATTRVTYAMGKDNTFLPWTGREHKRYKTPGNALWLHGIWTCILIITGSFDMLADMLVFVTWIVYGIGAYGIFLLRKRMPEKERPYRVWGYPLVPVLFILFAGFYLVVTIYNDVTNYLNDRQPVINSLLGLLLTSLGIPLYFYFTKTTKTKE